MRFGEHYNVPEIQLLTVNIKQNKLKNELSGDFDENKQGSWWKRIGENLQCERIKSKVKGNFLFSHIQTG